MRKGYGKRTVAASTGAAWTDNLLISLPALILCRVAALFMRGIDGKRRQEAKRKAGAVATSLSATEMGALNTAANQQQRTHIRRYTRSIG
jgi:hypothetical protein